MFIGPVFLFPRPACRIFSRAAPIYWKGYPIPMPLLALLGLTVVAYSLLIIFVSRASGKIDPYWSATIFGVASTVTPLALWMLSRAQQKPLLATTASGIAFSIAGGVVAGVFTALQVMIYGKGAVSFANPVIYGGAMALTAFVGWLFFKEHVSGTHAAGIALTLAGIALIVYSKAHGATA